MFFECDGKRCLLFAQGAFDTGKMYGLGAQKMVARTGGHYSGFTRVDSRCDGRLRPCAIHLHALLSFRFARALTLIHSATTVCAGAKRISKEPFRLC